jgi:hypothetical protein
VLFDEVIERQEGIDGQVRCRSEVNQGVLNREGSELLDVERQEEFVVLLDEVQGSQVNSDRNEG